MFCFRRIRREGHARQLSQRLINLAQSIPRCFLAAAVHPTGFAPTTWPRLRIHKGVVKAEDLMIAKTAPHSQMPDVKEDVEDPD